MRCANCGKGRMFRSKQSAFERFMYQPFWVLSVAVPCVPEPEDAAGSRGVAEQAFADLDGMRPRGGG